MNQVGLHDAWLKFLEDYVSPLQQRVFIGYDDVRIRNLGCMERAINDVQIAHCNTL